MKFIEKHFSHGVNETGVVLLTKLDSNQLLCENVIYIHFNSSKPIEYKLQLTNENDINKQFTYRGEKTNFYISNPTEEDITVRYSCSR